MVRYREVKERPKLDEMIPVKAYDLIKIGYTESQLAEHFGVSARVFQGWKKRSKALRWAIHQGKKCEVATNPKSDITFQEYVFNRLPRRLQLLWKEIEEIHDEDNDIQLEAVLSQHGTKTRQHLFLYAWTHSNFDMNAALNKLNISLTMFKTWVRTDPEFKELFESIHFYKKNFFEAALMEAVKAGDSPAIIFANKTINRDRGYNEKTEISVKGMVEHQVVPVDSLNLSLEERRNLLERMREVEVEEVEEDEL